MKKNNVSPRSVQLYIDLICKHNTLDDMYKFQTKCVWKNYLFIKYVTEKFTLLNIQPEKDDNDDDGNDSN